MEKACWFDLGESPTFQKIRMLIIRELVGLSDTDTESVSNQEIASRIFENAPDIRARNDVMLELEALLVKILSDCGCGPYGAMQFPANVRVLNSLRRRASREEYSTEHLHCDAWSGAPSDSWNHLLYVFTEAGCPRLDMRETLPIDHPLRKYVGPYDETVTSQVTGFQTVPIPCRPGVLASWPTYTPHRTEYQTAFVTDDFTRAPSRISVDFRTRTGHPYLEDRNFQTNEFAATKMNSAGVYWTYPNREFSELNQKIESEISAASRQGSVAVRQRREYLSNHYQGLSPL